MGTTLDITESLALSKHEIGAIKNYLVKFNRDVEQVKTEFCHTYGKRISAQVVKSILVKNEDEIQSLQKFWYEHPDQEEFFHLSVRLRHWKKLYDLALRPDQVIINTKLENDKWGVEKREDIKAASGVLKNAAWDKHTWQGLENDKLKLKGEAADEKLDDDDEPVVSSWSKRA